MHKSDKPNILVVMADQFNHSFLGFRSPFVKTPNLDKLAADGIVFSNFYCNSPLCAPSRASMVTGKLVSDLGSYDNAAEFRASVPTFMHHLRRAGYETTLSGKMHFIGPDQLHGFSRRLTTDIYPANFAWTPDWRQGANGNFSLARVGMENPGSVLWSEQLEFDTEVQTHALAAIREISRQKDRSPFLLCVSYTHPHDPYVITKEFWDLYEGTEIPPPGAPAKSVSEHHLFNQWIQARHGLDRHRPADRTAADARRAYCGMVSFVDAMVGQLLGEMSRLSLLENTIVIFTSDHGDMLGEHGMWYKRTFMQDSILVPFIVSWPGTWPAGSIIAGPASLVDLFPTLLEVSQVSDSAEIAETIDGASLVPWIEHGGDAPRTIFAEYCAEGVIHPAIAVIDGHFKYIHVPQCHPLLFDLGADPHEQMDLSGRQEMADICAILRQKIPAKWLDGTLETDIRQSQRRRLWIREAMRGGGQPWDYQPIFDAARQYRRDV